MAVSDPARRIGLVFGKFYPLHCGHIYLIECAANQVDELHIMLGCEATRDLRLFEQSRMPKQPQVKDRYNWLQKTFNKRPKIYIHILDEADIPAYPNGWQNWSDRVKAILSEHQVQPTVVFTSEAQDVDNHAYYYNCPVKLIDAERGFVPISATSIRQSPYKKWDFIAKAARPFFVKRIAIIGSRCSSLIPVQLANIYNTEYVENGYINYIQRGVSPEICGISDEDVFIKIAELHAKRIVEATQIANRVVFASFDFVTLNHYYQQQFNKESNILNELATLYPFDLVINESDFDASISDSVKFEAIMSMVNAQLF